MKYNTVFTMKNSVSWRHIMLLILQTRWILSAILSSMLLLVLIKRNICTQSSLLTLERSQANWSSFWVKSNLWRIQRHSRSRSNILLTWTLLPTRSSRWKEKSVLAVFWNSCAGLPMLKRFMKYLWVPLTWSSLLWLLNSPRKILRNIFLTWKDSKQLLIWLRESTKFQLISSDMIRQLLS